MFLSHYVYFYVFTSSIVLQYNVFVNKNLKKGDVFNAGKTFMTIREVAKTGILSEHTIRLMVKAGEVPHIMAGNRVLINYPKFIEQLQITA